MSDETAEVPYASMDALPMKYAYEFYQKNNSRRWISIFSTAEGDCVACDVFRSNPVNSEFDKDWKVLPRESDNYKLLHGEKRLTLLKSLVRSIPFCRSVVEAIEESYMNIRSFKLWTRQIEPKSSEGESKDSGRDTKEATSSSSYEATMGRDWIELHDVTSGTTTHDSGADTGHPVRTEPITLSGPSNMFKTELAARCK